MLRARQAIQHLEEYCPPLTGRSGLRLDFNENSVGCSPRVIARLASVTADDLARYPEREGVQSQVASFLRLTPKQLLLTNGLDEAIHLLCETYLEEGEQALLVSPSYSMYRIYAAATRARVVTVPAQDFRFPVQLLLASLTERTRFIAIANPNNPTGALASHIDLLELVDSAPQAAVLIDEAYYEFSGETLIDEIGSRSNLFVGRTFSKAYGMAGLRIGVLAGPAEQIRMIRKISSPYSVNQAALMCLPEALEDQSFMAWYVHQVKESRQRLQQQLRDLEIQYWPSHANFVLIRIGERKPAFVQAMKKRGILVRDRSSDPDCDGCVRITVGTREQTDRLIEALTAVWRELEVAQGTPA